MTVSLKVYEGNKYDIATRDYITIAYTDVESFLVVDRNADLVKEIERDTDGSCIDENHEYLIIYFNDGKTKSTFRNSHVDLFYGNIN